MDSFLFAVNAVLPIMLTIALGYCLKRIGWISQSFVVAANKLVFRVFLPAMLFLNVYKIEKFRGLDLTYIAYAIAVVLVLFLLFIPVVKLVTKNQKRRGVLLQGTFRSNYALIGIPLAQSLFGDEGVMVASLLLAVLVPMFNVLAVISLSLFRNADGEKPSVRRVLGDVLHNPLIQSIAIAFVVVFVRACFVRWGVAFRLTDVVPLYKLLNSLSGVATPLALLMLGAQFEFSAIKELRREIVFGTLVRTVVMPLIGIGVAYVCFAARFSGAHFAAFVSAFATPVAVSSVPMSQEMDGDVPLAGQLVVWTTLVSAASIFVIAFLLRTVGVFG